MGCKNWNAALLVVLLLTLAGCGQKGPLYREEPQQQDQAQAQEVPTVTLTAPLCNEYAARLG